MYDVVEVHHVSRSGLLKVRTFETFDDAHAYSSRAAVLPDETAAVILGIVYDMDGHTIIVSDELDYLTVN